MFRMKGAFPTVVILHDWLDLPSPCGAGSRPVFIGEPIAARRPETSQGANPTRSKTVSSPMLMENPPLSGRVCMMDFTVCVERPFDTVVCDSVLIGAALAATRDAT